MRYLIVKTSAFGDVVQAYPVIQYIKSLDPEAVIDWVVEKRVKSLLETHPDISRVIVIDGKEWKKKLWQKSTWKEIRASIHEIRSYEYEAVFDLQGNSKSAFITLCAKAQKKVGFGWKSAPERINCLATCNRTNPPKGQNIRRDYLTIVQNYFKKHYGTVHEEIKLKVNEQEKSLLQKYIDKLEETPWMICHGSQWKNKQYPEEKLIAFLEHAKNVYNPFFIFIAGNKEEEAVCKRLNTLFPHSLLVIKEPISLLQHLMDHMELVISMDSLPLQLAGTTKVPTFSLFGPSTSYKYRPLGESHFSFQGSCPYGTTFEKRCPILRSCPTGACLKDVSPDLIFSTFSEWWNQRKRKSLLENIIK